MPEWPYDYCPLLFSLEGRQAEDSLEGEVARALFGQGHPVHVVAPVLPVDADDAAARIVNPTPKLFRQLATFQPPGGQVWAEGEDTAAFAQVLPDGGLRVLRIDAGEASQAVVDPFALVRKPTALLPERGGATADADKFNPAAYDFDLARERLQEWVSEHLVFSPARNGKPEATPANAAGARAFRLRDLVIVVLGCQEPRMRVIWP